MRVLVQRVSTAHVSVDDCIIGKIDAGLVLLIGFGQSDRNQIDNLISNAIHKILHLRIFTNDQGRLDYSVIDIEGEILAVPQFTLYGNVNSGRRPDFADALIPKLASPAFDQFVDNLQEQLGRPVVSGVFGANMQVSLVNNGPITLHLEF